MPNLRNLCSGSGGAMIDVFKILKSKPDTKDLELILTDLYPNVELASTINQAQVADLSYNVSPVNATNVTSELTGVLLLKLI